MPTKSKRLTSSGGVWREKNGHPIYISSGGKVLVGVEAFHAYVSDKNSGKLEVEGKPSKKKSSLDEKDSITASMYTGNVEVNKYANVVDFEFDAFDKEMSHSDYQKVFGVPDGSKVNVFIGEHNGQKVMTLRAEGNWGWMERSVTATGFGKCKVSNENLEVSKNQQGTGIGTRILAHQVAHANDYGVVEISTVANGNLKSPNQNGYITWPKLGYDGTIPKSSRERAEADGFTGVKTVHDLLSHPKGGGVEWWTNNGSTFVAKFDLSPGSTSRKVLHEYTKKKGINVGKSIL